MSSEEPSRRPRLLRRENHGSILPGMTITRRPRQPPAEGSNTSSTETASSPNTTPGNCEEDEEWVIEIGGEYKPLRLSEETEMAWAMGQCVSTSCMMCTMRLACIKDVDAVVCPECLSLSPIDLTNSSSMSDVAGAPMRSPSHRGGVGIGIQLS